uniref:Glyco_hydro_18 domain-containing protein n=1 Tax=Panagrellus redivivus TaxID=6233 RepID=A0A7E4VQP5_PANRE
MKNCMLPNLTIMFTTDEPFAKFNFNDFYTLLKIQRKGVSIMISAMGYTPEFESYTHKKVRAQKDYAFATLRDALTYVYASRILFIKRLRSRNKKTTLCVFFTLLRATVMLHHNSFVATWYLPLTTDSAPGRLNHSELPVTESEL